MREGERECEAPVKKSTWGSAPNPGQGDLSMVPLANPNRPGLCPGPNAEEYFLSVTDISLSGRAAGCPVAPRLEPIVPY